MRAVAYTCLVIVGVGISDQPFANGSFFQTAGAQQVRQAQQQQQERVIHYGCLTLIVLWIVFGLWFFFHMNR